MNPVPLSQDCDGPIAPPSLLPPSNIYLFDRVNQFHRALKSKYNSIKKYTHNMSDVFDFIYMVSLVVFFSQSLRVHAGLPRIWFNKLI